MSPPAGDIYCFSLRVCPSVRPCVRPFVCNAFLIRAISPRTFRAKNLQNIRKITYLLKLCNKKSKFNFAKNFGSFGQKTLFGIVFYPGQISVTIKDRDTKISCSVSKNIPIVQRQGQICKMSNFGRF